VSLSPGDRVAGELARHGATPPDVVIEPDAEMLARAAAAALDP